VNLCVNQREPKQGSGCRKYISRRAPQIMNEKVIVEIKSVEALNDVHRKQLLTYLKLSGKKLGLLINFNVSNLKSGIERIVNKL
jgi:GxxExxY protein